MSSAAPADAAAPAAGAPRETRHAMKLRHKAALKALLAAPAKGIGAKKAQKDAATALEAAQALEVAEFDRREQAEKDAEEAAETGGAAAAAPAAAADGEEEDDEPSSSAASPTPAAAAASSGGKPSRAQQKKAKAAQKDAARLAQLRAETADMKDERGEENAAIAALLAKDSSASASSSPEQHPRRGLRVKEMVSDGHCLYRALADQVRQHHLARDLPLNANVAPFISMRLLCAEYMRSHRDEFAPFMLSESAEGPMSDAEWESFLRSLQSEQEAVWGGHTEIVALSKALKRPIIVWSAAGKMEVGEEFRPAAAAGASDASAASAASAVSPSASPLSPGSPSPDQSPLHISFHRHYFGLGNHYNSVVEKTEEEVEEEGISRAVGKVQIKEDAKKGSK